MKCPKCQAKLLPVNGQMFCLQDGEVYRPVDGEDLSAPLLEETTDPLLQKAINDGLPHPMEFRLPVAMSPPKQRTVPMASLRELVAPPHPLAVSGGGLARAIPISVPQPQPMATSEPVPLKLDVDQINLVDHSEVVRPGHRRWVWWLIATVAAAVLLAGLNLAAAIAYEGRVYPGVRLGQTAVGGEAGTVLDDRLRLLAAHSTLELTADGQQLTLDTATFAELDVAAVKSRVMAVGRDQPLALLGIVTSWLSEPVELAYVIHDGALKQTVSTVAAELNRLARNAQPLVLNGQTVLLPEKPGLSVRPEPFRQALKAAVGSQQALAVPVQDESPLVGSEAFSADLAQAQAMMATPVTITLRGSVHRPTPAQIGDWLRFGAAGKGVAVDTGSVAAYVQSLSTSRFDRRAMVTAIQQAVQNRQALAYTAVTGRNTTVPAVAAVPVSPAQYGYCLSPYAGAGWPEQLAVAIQNPAGWSLGGRLQFVPRTKGCDFSVALYTPAEMKGLHPACAGQQTCRVSNQLAIQTDAWQESPDGWSGGRAAYQFELVQHEVGHWLGFDHPACTKAEAKPVLSLPSVTLGQGCSPAWYAVPVEPALATKVLPGFR